MSPKRRGRGEGAIGQRHNHPTCPAAVNGQRPVHRCRGTWYATMSVYVDGKRRRPTMYAKTRTGALRALDRMRQEYQRTGAIPQRGWTVHRWLDHYLTDIAPARARDLTLYNYRRRCELYVYPIIGDIRLDRLQPEHIRQVYQAMAGKADGTKRGVHAVLTRALDIAEREGKIPRNVATLIDAPATRTKPGHPLTVAEARRVLEAAEGDRMEARWFLALYGLRQSEALGLMWTDVDWGHETLTIERGLHRVPGKGFTFEHPKAEASHRTIPLVPMWLGALRRRWVAYLEEAKAPHYQDTGLIFTNRRGGPIDPRSDNRGWTALTTKAHVPRVRLHDARGTTSTLLMDLGIPDRIIAEILGHADATITRNVYQRGDAVMRAEAMRALEARLSGDD